MQEALFVLEICISAAFTHNVQSSFLRPAGCRVHDLNYLNVFCTQVLDSASVDAFCKVTDDQIQVSEADACLKKNLE